MGYMTELNTLIGLPKDFDPATLKVGETYSILKERERSFPLHIAMLLVDSQWNFYGYAKADSLFSKGGKSILEFTVISLFSPEEREIYKRNFVAAAKETGEVK